MKISRSKIKKKLEPLVKEFVKKRDNYTCQHCGKKVEGTNCHASHVFPVGSHSCVQFDPINLKVLCYHCHINWWHKNPIKAGEWFTKTFPERQAYLEEQVKLNAKISTVRLQEMITEYKEME